MNNEFNRRRKVYSREKIADDLKKMGINKGDVILVRAGLRKVGRLVDGKKENYLNAILDAVGENGTVIGLSFSKSFFIKPDKNYIFDINSPANTGSFVKLMLAHPDSVRSFHPTNSYVAIGQNARYILSNHDEHSGAYDPIKKVIELNGKMILIGCVGSSPGFTTTHLAEVNLKYHRKVIFPTLTRVYFQKKNKIELFKRKDLGGCSPTFYRFYGYYVKNEILKQGYVGNAYSVIIDAKKAYEVDEKVLKENPRINICDNPNCFLCRCRRWDNLKDMPGFIVRKVIHKLKRMSK